MSLPTKPPVDNQKGLSLEDVYACIWFVWKRTFKKEDQCPAPFDLMQFKIKSSYPPRPWGLPAAPDGPAQKFVIDIHRVILAYTQVKVSVPFSAFVQAYSGGKTWADLSALFYASGAKAEALAHAAAINGLADGEAEGDA
jgi:hypothetical protein